MLLRFFHSNSREIENSRVLTLYGISLFLIHALTSFFWFTDPKVITNLSKNGEAICWPQIPNCASFKIFAPFVIESILYFYFFLGFVGVILLLKRQILRAYWLAVICLIIMFGVFVQDYRLMGNYHYMAFILMFLYLFVPEKKKTIGIMICLFYLAAAGLKLNKDWISGEALFAPTWLSGSWLTAGLFYVIALEAIFVWGLLAKNGKVFWFTLSQFIVFHIYSWHLVGFFYPCEMFLILSIFVFLRFNSEECLDVRQLFLLKAPRVTYIFAGIFILLQVPPLVMSPDSPVTGEGRIYALNMFDAKVRCVHFSYSQGDLYTEELSKGRTDLGMRIQCDPIVYWNMARNECRKLKEANSEQNINLYLYSRRSSEGQFHRIVGMEDFCKKNPSYSIFGNSWIGYGPGEAYPQVGYTDRSLASSDSSSQYYRLDPSRTNTIRWQSSTHFKEEWRQSNGNIGVHTASKASPAVDASGVYIGGDSSQFFAYDHKGNFRWSFYVGNSFRGIHSTAVLDEKFVYFGAYNGRFYKLRKSDGKLVWAINLGNAIGASPLLVEGAIYLAVELENIPDGFVAKVDKNSGKVIWRSQLLGEQSHSSPVLDLTRKRIYLGANNGKFFAINESDGSFLWQFKAGGEIKSTALLDKELYFTSWDKSFYALNPDSGALNWALDMDSRSQSSPTLIPHSNIIVVAVGSGQIIGIDRASHKIGWRTNFETAWPNLASGLALDKGKEGSVLIGCGKSKLCEFGPLGKIQEFPLKGLLSGVAVPYEDGLFLSENAVDKKSIGELVKITALPGRAIANQRTRPLPK